MCVRALRYFFSTCSFALDTDSEYLKHHYIFVADRTEAGTELTVGWIYGAVFRRREPVKKGRNEWEGKVSFCSRRNAHTVRRLGRANCERRRRQQSDVRTGD